MKTKPILFSTQMVKAILEGRKTQTRRIIKPQPSKQLFDANMGYWSEEPKNLKQPYLKAKYQVGDILWVRETWKVGSWNDFDEKVAFDYKAYPDLKNTPWVYYNDYDRFLELLSKCLCELDGLGIEPIVDEDNEMFYYKWEAGQSPFKWKPSIHMPREAARIFLKVTGVRVERLQDISEEDAIAEGIERIADYGTTGYKLYTQPDAAFSDIDAKWSFESLWHSINGEESWNENPFVWVYDFERIEKPLKF